MKLNLKQFRIRYFYINLDRDIERRIDIENEASKTKLKIERFAAFLGTAIPEFLTTYFDKAEKKLSRGEIGCYASHLALCKELVNDSYHDAYLILEDDVSIDKNISELISFICNLDISWDRIHLTGDVKFSMIEISRIHNYSIVKYSKIPTNGAGYIISKEGAQKFLKYRKIKRALDHDFQRDWQFGMTTLGVYPQPIQQKGHMISTIDAVDPRKRTLSYKLFIDTPLDFIKSIFNSISLLGFINFIFIQILNLRIKFIKVVKSKRVVFLIKRTKIEKFNIN